MGKGHGYEWKHWDSGFTLFELNDAPLPYNVNYTWFWERILKRDGIYCFKVALIHT